MKLITLNKLNRFWKNGVVAKMIAKTKVLTTMEQVKANTNAENVTSAIATKELYNNLTKVSNRIGNITLVENSDGTIGYKKDGADTVIPFKSKLPFYISNVQKGYSRTSPYYLINIDVSNFDSLAIAGMGASQFGDAGLRYCEDYVESSKYAFSSSTINLSMLDITNVKTVQIKQKSGNGSSSCQSNFKLLLVPFNKGSEITIL